MSPETHIACFGCGALVPNTEGPTHAYIGAPPGCWAIYTSILEREYGEFRNPPCHRLTVDSYAAQHPGVPSRRSIQSVAVHLVSLHLVLELAFDHQEATRALAKFTGNGVPYIWIEPPTAPDWLTVVDVCGAPDLTEHERRVIRWARSVWDAWSEHHDTVRSWASRSLDLNRG
ncbi:MAG: DUF5946 family protein [candidate division Zixibacteria bacterium]|nr:DUF5946 family protein [candidate division Zixibacteria bacterium]